MVDTDVSTLAAWASRPHSGRPALLSDAPSDDGDGLHDNVEINDVFGKTYSIFPRKEGKARGKQLYTALLKNGRNISGAGRVRLDHQQVYLAVQGYAAEVGCRDPDKVQHFSTFMNMTVLDYAERTRVDYESWMAEKYGPDWRRVKYAYT